MKKYSEPGGVLRAMAKAMHNAFDNKKSFENIVDSRASIWWASCIRIFGVLLLVIFFLSSCSTARINHFKNLSEAGIAYTKALEPFLEEAGSVSIDTNSQELIEVRDLLSIEERKKKIGEHNRIVRERMEILGALKRHAYLLQRYFETLATLADSESPSGIGTAAEGVINAMGEIHPQIKDATVGNMEVSEFVGSATKIAVAHFKVAALEKELKARAETIERELDLQQAALSAIAKEMRINLESRIADIEHEEIVLPYVGVSSDISSPSAWMKRRREIFSSRISLASAEAAASAAEKLKIAFVALSEGRFSLVDIPALVNDINEVLTLIEKVRDKDEK
jgi:hypothetical protein